MIDRRKNIAIIAFPGFLEFFVLECTSRSILNLFAHLKFFVYLYLFSLVFWYHKLIKLI